MNFLEELRKLKLKELMDNEQKYPFPQFMRLVRKTLGITRKSVAEIVGVSVSKIFFLESGKFVRGSDPEFIVTLANVYGIDAPFVLNKLDEYVSNKLPNKA